VYWPPLARSLVLALAPYWLFYCFVERKNKPLIRPFLCEGPFILPFVSAALIAMITASFTVFHKAFAKSKLAVRLLEVV
jgi:hypothetical protein